MKLGDRCSVMGHSSEAPVCRRGGQIGGLNCDAVCDGSDTWRHRDNSSSQAV